MSPLTTRHPHARFDDLDALRSLCREIRDFLERSKRSLDEEIRTYPTPIPRCDAQFNFLYEQRSRTAQVLALVTDALEGPTGSADLANFARRFVNAEPCVDGRDESALRTRLRVELARRESTAARFAPPLE